MTDNIFEQLFELFQQPGPVNWKLANEILKTVVGPGEPIEPRLAEEYRELATAAQLRLQEVMPVDVPSNDLHPVDARTWAQENHQSFRHLIEPLADKLAIGGASGEGDPMAALLQPLGPALLGMQAGSMVGLMSRRILGQFDIGVPPTESDKMYVVVPNVEAFASEHGLDHQQVRLWTVMHEVAYHAELEVEWVRERFHDLIESFYDTVEFDPSGLTEALGSMQDPGALQELLGGEADMSKLIGSSHDAARLGELQAFIAFLEGYADFAVRKAGGNLLPDLERIDEAQGRRRAQPTEAEESLRQLTGLEFQRHRVRDAAALCAEIERRWGPETLTDIWDDPERLPHLTELNDAVGWAARVLLD